MQLIIEKGIRGRIYHAIRLYANVNKKYTKGYNKENESSSLIHWDVNLYGWAMSPQLPIDNFKC